MKRPGVIILALLFLVVLVATEIHFIRLGTLPVTTKVIFLILLNLNIIALLTLMFFVAKALTRLYLERKQNVLGSRFKTKIVVIFVILTSIPSVLLFIGASGLLTRYVDRWFTPQFRQPIDSTLNIARAIYDIERQKTLSAANAVASGRSYPAEYTVTRFRALPDNPSDVIKDAFDGIEGTEVISGENGDTVRAVVPDLTSSGRVQGIVVVESHIPREITVNVEQIKNAYEDYIKLEAWKQPLKLNYLIFLGFFTLIVIFTALWVSLRIARGISEPIQKLAEATGQVAAGNLDAAIGLKRDDEIGLLITSFNHMVSELKESKESIHAAYTESDRRRLYMENILENIQSGVICLDAEGRVMTINSAACRILDLVSEHVTGKNYKEILSAIQSDSLQQMIRGIKLKTLRTIEREVWATIRGKRTMIKVSIMGLREHASYLGLLVVFDDLTNVIKAQKALAWQEVARRIAHEVKNPLTPIKLSTERMLKKWQHKDEDFPQVFEGSMRTIIREVDSLRRLVDEFTRFEKMPEINRSPSSLADIIDGVVTLYKDYKGFSITTSLPENMPLVDLDGEQFKRVLINLFENAIQAMNNGGAIAVSVSLDDPANRVFINVADDGPGIREEDKEKLFLPYFSTKKEGTGLGLAIASRIIREHMGSLRVSDNLPRGTVFTIELPIKEG
jgi:two-component system nitrogen regulation sensor histidine kinase NtrY